MIHYPINIEEIQSRLTKFMRGVPWAGQSLPDAVRILDTEACGIAGVCEVLCLEVKQLRAERTAWLQQAAAEHDTEPYHVAKHHQLQTTIEDLERELQATKSFDLRQPQVQTFLVRCLAEQACLTESEAYAYLAPAFAKVVGEDHA